MTNDAVREGCVVVNILGTNPLRTSPDVQPSVVAPDLLQWVEIGSG